MDLADRDWPVDFVPGETRRSLPTPPMKLGARFYLDDLTPTPSRIRWRRQRGAIGQSWYLRDSFFFSQDEKWATVSNEAAWGSLPMQDQIGLSYPQACRLKQYGQVAAVPIWKSTKRPNWYAYAGCVVVDLPHHTTELFRLDSEEIQELLRVSSKHIADQIA
jgi:hypothetical protein